MDNYYVQIVHFKRKSPSLSNSDLDVVESDNKLTYCQKLDSLDYIYVADSMGHSFNKFDVVSYKM